VTLTVWPQLTLKWEPKQSQGQRCCAETGELGKSLCTVCKTVSAPSSTLLQIRGFQSQEGPS
jgi:hypothetical protein